MKPQAFTLIELLIVVAIIGVLAAIAVPNFLNAQVRAEIAKCKGDMKSFTTALEAYRIDHNKYPEPIRPVRWNTSDHTATLTELTTPVSYMTTIDMEDPFVMRKFWTSWEVNQTHPAYVYVYYRGFWGKTSSGGIAGRYGTTPALLPDGVVMHSRGPSGKSGLAVLWPLEKYYNNVELNDAIYAPSNGLRSQGCISAFLGLMPRPSELGG
ncbi:MAG: type IV pilin protein [bacterium]